MIQIYHGVAAHDPWRWLEGADARAVERWIDARDTYTEKVLDEIKDAKAIAKRVGELALTSTWRYAPTIVAGMLFYLRETPPQPGLAAERWPNGATKVLIEAYASGGSVAITNCWPPPDGKCIAYGTAVGGGEATTIRFVDGADGKGAADALADAGAGNFAVAPGFFAEELGLGPAPAANAQQKDVSAVASARTTLPN